MDNDNNVYYRDGNSILKKDAATGATSFIVGSQRMEGPDGLSLDNAGNLYFVNTWAYQVFQMSTSGAVSHLAGNGDQVGENFEGTFSGDGGPALQAGLHGARSTAVDANGNVYIADLNNSRIRRVDGITGIITTVAGNGVQSPAIWDVPIYSAGDGGPATDATFGVDFRVAVDSSGDVYISDTYRGRVRKLDVDTGIITTFAGGGVNLRGPAGVFVDPAGNIYMANEYGGHIFKILPSGEVIVVGGTGQDGYSGDGGAATDGAINNPRDLVVDGAGNIFIADRGNNRVRKIEAATGIITTLAGNGNQEFSGDDGPAVNAGLDNPYGVAVDASGNVYIADTGNSRVRKVDAATGTITTVAGGGTTFADTLATEVDLSQPTDVFVDAAGTLYIGEANGVSKKVRKLDVSGNLVTVAGSDQAGFSGDGGPATDATLSEAMSIFVTDAGDIYIWDSGNQRARKVDGTTGIITTVAGNGSEGSSGDGSAATDASFSSSGQGGIFVDASGNIYISDSNNSRIRKVDAATGIVTTVVGVGSERGDGGLVSNSTLSWPTYVTVDGLDNVLISDGHKIRKVDATTGIITTIVGTDDPDFTGDGGPATDATLNEPRNFFVGSTGDIYIHDTHNYRIRKIDAATGIINTVVGNGAQGFSGDGGPATDASIDAPYQGNIVVDASGNIFLADNGNNRIRKVDAATGIINTLLGEKELVGNGDGGPATDAQFNSLQYISVDSGGNIYFADQSDHVIRKIDISTGIINTIAGIGESGFSGDGGPATDASLNRPRGVDLDPAGNIYVAEFSNGRIRKIDTSGIITTFAGGHATSGDRGTLEPFLADGGPATDARLNSTTGVAVDNLGNVYIADRGNKRVRKVDTAGIITTVLGDFVGDGGLATDAALWNPNDLFVTANGDIYIADRRNNEIRKVDSSTGIINSVVGTGEYAINPDGSTIQSPDGTLATAAGVRGPRWSWVTDTGDILFSDDGVVRKVDAGDGTISTLAGARPPAEDLEFRGDGGPALEARLFAFDIFVDGADNIYIAENGEVRKVDTSTGMIGRVAGTGERGYSGDGGPALEAQMGAIRHLFIDSVGDLYLADQANHRIRKVDANTGIITTVAGNGSGGADGDDGPATDARINSPWGVAVDDGGNIFIASSNSHRIRKVDGATGTITTVAGGSTRQMWAGDGGPATETTLWNPIDVSLDNQGNLYIAENSGYRVRKVEGIAVPTTIGVGVFNGPVFAPEPDVPDPPVFTAVDIFPADNATGVPRTLTILGPATDADADSLTYKVFVGADAGSLVEVAQGLEEGSYTLQGEFLETIFWQMEVSDGLHTVLSGIRQFTIQDDTSPPVLSKVDAVDISDEAATITWSTNKLSESRVVYGLAADLSDSTAGPVSADPVLDHAVELAGLTAATTYYYQASSANAAGNEGKSGIQNFNTLSAPDTQAPGFVLGPLVESIADNSAAVRWEATELVDGAVTVATVGTDSSTTLALEHLVFLSGLDPSTAYTVTVSISDGAGNETTSAAIPFTTKAAPDTKAPVFLQLPQVSVTHIAAAISWEVDEPSDSRVLYGLQEGNLTNTVEADVAGLFTTVDILDLEPDTDYFYKVESEDQAGNILSSPTLTFSTLAEPDVAAPQVVEGPSSQGISQEQATIAWRTDETAFSRVIYDSVAVTIGSDRTLQSTAPSQGHSHRLSGLAAGTTYQYQLVSIDGAGNADTSVVSQFKTLAVPDTEAPVLTAQPVISGVNSDGLTVEWGTNEASTTEVTAAPVGAPTLDPVVRVLPDLVKDHQAFMGGLTASTAYSVTISSKDGAGNLLQVTLPDITTLAVPDTAPPEIVGPPAVLQVTDTRAIIVWETNELTDGYVEVDSLVDMTTFQRVGSSAPSRTHNVTLTNLTPDETYHYRVSSTDVSGNGPTIKPDDRVLLFRTLAAPDVTAPVLLWGPSAVSPSETSVQIQWSTSEPADARVRYALDQADLSDDLSVFDARLLQVHEINLTGLEPDTTYFYEVFSTDGSKNGPTGSTVNSFSTLAAPDTQAPVLTSGPSGLDVTSNSALIGWTTNEPSNSGVEINGALTSRSESVVFHQIRVTALTPETNYTLRVHSTDAAGNKVSQDGLDFRTRRLPDSNPPVILEGPSVTYASDIQATVSWETDESSYSKVVFGPVDSFVDNPLQPVTDNTLVNFHSITVTGLEVGTRYLFRVISEDGAGNQVVAGTLQGFVAKQGVVTKLVQPPGGDGSFTTSTEADTQLPVILSGPHVVSATATSLTVEWKTDESSDSGVNFGVDDLNSRTEQGQDVGNHRLTLTNLTPGQSYQYQIQSTDPAGNGPTTSQVYLAKTAAAGDVTPPRIATAAKVIYKTERAATIAWQTDEAAASFLAFGTEALDDQKALPDFVTNHQITLTNLSASTDYKYSVRATDAAGNGPTQGQELTFTTEAQPDIESPSISDVEAVAITDETALIQWESNELSDSAVKYAEGEGLSGGDLGLLTGSAKDVTSHEVALTNLTPGTTYTFLVESTDRSDNGPVSSNPISFTTAEGKDETAPGVPQGVSARGAGGVLIISPGTPWTTRTWQATMSSGQLVMVTWSPWPHWSRIPFTGMTDSTASSPTATPFAQLTGHRTPAKLRKPLRLRLTEPDFWMHRLRLD